MDSIYNEPDENNMNSLTKEDIDKSIGQVLKRFRRSYRLTQEKISEQVGISLKYVSRIENGNGGISTETLIKYMNSLGITPNTIYKDFIENEKVKKQIELSEKLNSLSEEKLIFLSTIIELLKDL